MARKGRKRSRETHAEPPLCPATALLSPTPVPAVDPTGCSLEDRLRACWQWCLSQGASAPKLRLGAGPYGWGLFASSPLAAGETFASIPLHLVLTHGRADDSDVGRAVAEANARTQSSSPLPHPRRVVSPRTSLYLYMIHCLHTPSSPFHHYVSSFPASTSPLHWSPASLALLSGTNLHQAIPHKLRLLQRRHSNAFPLLSSLHPSLFPPSHYSFPAFLWAHTALTSRGFPLRVGQPCPLTDPPVVDGLFRSEGERRPNEAVGCLLPLLDLTNHRLRTPVTWTTDDSRVAFRTGAGVAEGCEVLNNYGAKANEEFLLGYGFCLPDNPHDEFTVQLGGLSASVSHTLALYGLRWRDKGHYLMRAFIPPALLHTLRVVVATPAEAALLRCPPHAVGRLDFVSRRNEAATLRVLEREIVGRLHRMGHENKAEGWAADAADVKSLEGTVQGVEERLAAEYVRGQRLILLTVLDAIDRMQAAAASKVTGDRGLGRLYRLQPPIAEPTLVASRSNAEQWERAKRLTPEADCPLELSPQSLAESSFAEALDYAQGLSPHQQLCLFLLHHRYLGEASPYHPLLRFFAHPSHPSHVLQAAVSATPNAELLEVSDVHAQLFPALTEANAELFPASAHTLDLFLWSHLLVHSHATLKDGQLTLRMSPAPQRGDGSEGGDGGSTDGRSLWTRGEYRTGQSSVQLEHSALLSASALAEVADAAREAVSRLWDGADESTGVPYFVVGERGVGDGLLACCRLLTLTEAELRAAVAAAANEDSQATTAEAAVPSPIVLDSDEAEDEEEASTALPETSGARAGDDEEAEGEDGAGEGEEEEEAQLAAQRFQSRLLVGAPLRSAFARLQALLDGWLAARATPASTGSPEATADDGEACEVDWPSLQAARERDCRRVVESCRAWTETLLSTDDSIPHRCAAE